MKQGNGAYSYVIEQLQAGSDKKTIIQGIRDKGMSNSEAKEFVDGIYPRYASAQMQAGTSRATITENLARMQMAPKEASELVDGLYARYVIEKSKQGLDKSTVSKALSEMGMSGAEAAQFVDTTYAEVQQAVEAERLSAASLLRAGAGGLVAAIIGGVIWGLIVIVTDYEIGFMAWGVGLLAGYGVLLVAGGKRGVPLQGIAVLASLLGIVLGKYYMYVHFLRQVVQEEVGESAASAVTLFSGDVVDAFMTDFTALLNVYDILWVGLAVYTAWRIPKGFGLRSPGR